MMNQIPLKINRLLLFLLFPLIACHDQKPRVQTPPSAADAQTVIDSQNAYFVNLELADGALRKSPELGKSGIEIDPYFSNITASAMLEDPANIPAVKKWIVWYLGKIGADGIIDNQWATITNGTITYQDAGTYDSIDSYAATFISVCRKLYDKSPTDKGWLVNEQPQINKVAGALEAMLDPGDGLTWNIKKTDARGQVKYTMDNAEANKGMQDLVYLQINVFNTSPAKWQTYQVNNFNALKKLWDANEGYYLIAIDTPPVLNDLNPSAACQFYTLTNGLIKPACDTVAKAALYFNNNYPDWPAAGLRDSGGFPCTVIAYAMGLAGDQNRLGTYLGNIEYQIDLNTLPGTWYNMEAAEIIMASRLYIKMLQNHAK